MPKNCEKQTTAEDSPKDVLLVAGKTEDGEGLRGLRWQRERPDGVSLTELRPVVHGQALVHGELVSLSQRQESPLLWDVDVACRVDQGKVVENETSRGGPALVVSDRYRQGWDQVFGHSQVGKRDREDMN
jgi:hypothetical protein